jgi:PRC-barrel domain protein
MPEDQSPDAAEAQTWIGARLDDLGGTAVGKIDGFFVDEDSGRPEWLVVRLGRFGQQGLVPAREAVGVAGRVWVPYRREAMKAAPRGGTKAPLTREAELELLKHFGAGGDAGRTAELNARGFEAITSSPAP